MKNHQGCKMKFRNQLAVNLVKLLAPVHSCPGTDVDPVHLSFDIANRVVARIQQDVDADKPKTASADAPVNYAAEVAARAAEGQPEERRFFLITDEGQLFPKRYESFEDFLTRALFNLGGK